MDVDSKSLEATMSGFGALADPIHFRYVLVEDKLCREEVRAGLRDPVPRDGPEDDLHLR